MFAIGIDDVKISTGSCEAYPAFSTPGSTILISMRVFCCDSFQNRSEEQAGFGKAESASS